MRPRLCMSRIKVGATESMEGLWKIHSFKQALGLDLMVKYIDRHAHGSDASSMGDEMKMLSVL